MRHRSAGRDDAWRRRARRRRRAVGPIFAASQSVMAGVVHGKAVAVLGDRHDIARAGVDKEIEPGIGIEVLGAKHGDEVLVAEFRLRAVGFNVVPEGGGAFHIHVARIPLVSECRNRIDAPVDEDAELGVAKPIGNAIGGERIPVGAKRTGAQTGVDARELSLLGVRCRRLSKSNGKKRWKERQKKSATEMLAGFAACHANQTSRPAVCLGIAFLPRAAVSRGSCCLLCLAGSPGGACGFALRLWVAGWPL